MHTWSTQLDVYYDPSTRLKLKQFKDVFLFKILSIPNLLWRAEVDILGVPVAPDIKNHCTNLTEAIFP
jgi:hypothetical protein